MNTSIKTIIMQSLAKDGRVRITVQALSIQDAKDIARKQHGIEFYFKGYQS